MELISEHPFTHKGKVFVRKLFRTETGFSVITDLDGKQVSPSYSVNFETHFDFFIQHKARLTDELLSLAESDIQAEMYFRS